MGEGSALRANVKKKGGNYIIYPDEDMFVNELNAEDGNNTTLQWWKKKHVQYS
jgi:hypothetical protein